jgi:acyl-coenzyme A synthetase/AMP-(fatty) acid ligase
MKHGVFDEGIFAFVRPKKDTDITAGMVMKHCEKIASYKRPQHAEIWPPEREFPLTRSTKVDKLELQNIAGPIVEKLREDGTWD